MYREPTNSLNLTKSAFSTFKRYQPITAPNTPASAPVKPASAPVKPASAPITTTIISPKLLNVSQPAAHAKTY